MPKVTPTTFTSERSRRISRLPARYRPDLPSSVTAPPAVPHRAGVCHRGPPGSVDNARLGRGIVAPADSASSSLASPAQIVEKNLTVHPGPNQSSQRTLATSRIANLPRIDSSHSVERRQQQLIEEKDASIEELKGRIRRLERSERRLKAQVIEGSDNFANKDAELGEVMRALQNAEERLEEQEELMRGLIGEVHHYQGWWLNEYYCLKVALKLARNQNDEGVKAMRESSHSRFMTWSETHRS